MLKFRIWEALPLISNIPVTLDLAQSLQTFQETITKALALGDVREWDGRTLKQREQQIRQAALILAGRCSNSVES